MNNWKINPKDVCQKTMSVQCTANRWVLLYPNLKFRVVPLGIVGLDPLPLPKMFSSVTIWAKGKAIFDSVLTVLGKVYFMMDFKIRRSVLAAGKRCRFFTSFTCAGCAKKNFGDHIGVARICRRDCDNFRRNLGRDLEPRKSLLSRPLFCQSDTLAKVSIEHGLVDGRFSSAVDRPYEFKPF